MDLQELCEKMKVIQYWCRKGMTAVYLAAAAVIAAVFAAADGRGVPVFLRMLPAVYCLLLLFRTADDWFDYEKDSGRKPQPLSKKQLICMFCVLSVICVLLHVLLFGCKGLFVLAAVVLILLTEKIPLLKPVYLAGMFLFYFALNGTVPGIRQLAVCIGGLLASVLYAGVKRKKS